MKALFFENSLLRVAALKIFERLSRNAAFSAVAPLRYRDVPEPALPNPRWLKVRNIQCGLCGTDLHFMFMDLHPKCFSAAMPGIRRKYLGHELVGEVVEAGSEAGGFAAGGRVVMRIDWPSCFQLEIDPPCPQCAAGNYMLCEKQGLRAPALEDVGGGFSPFMVMHRTQPYSVPAGLSNDAAVLIEPLASAAHGVLKAPPAPGMRVLVIGGGTIGLLTCAVLRGLTPGVEVWCLVRYDFQATVAEAFGAHPIREGDGIYRRLAEASQARHIAGPFRNEILLGGFDRVYDTVGSDTTLHNALRWARGGGSVVLMGINFNPGKIDYSPVWCQEVNLVGINCHADEAGGENSFDIAARLLAGTAIDPNLIITHRFPVFAYREAVRVFQNKGRSRAIKIVLTH